MAFGVGIGNDAVVDQDHHPVVAVLDRDQAVLFQRRERRLDVVDVGIDGSAYLEDGHPLLRAIDERVEDRYLDVPPVPELAPRSHTRVLSRIGYTLTAVSAGRHRSGPRVVGSARRRAEAASAVRLTEQVHF